MKNSIRQVADTYDCMLIYLFGSQASSGKKYFEGENVSPSPFSDLDIAVAFQVPPQNTISVYGKLYAELSGIFDPFSVDLVFMHELSPLFQYEIIKGVLIFEKDTETTYNFEEKVMKQAEDLSFKKRIFDADVMEAIENGYIEFEYVPHS